MSNIVLARRGRSNILTALRMSSFELNSSFKPSGDQEQAIGKLLKSAAANAENNFSMNRDALYVAQALVSPGPTLKRVMPRAQGRAFRINKRTSHVTVVVKER